MPMKLDLTRRGIRPLAIRDEESGETVRFEFDKILNRQERATMVRRIGKGRQEREVADLEKIFTRCIKRMGPFDPSSFEGISSDPDTFDSENYIVKKEIIAQVLLIPENMGGLPEEMVATVTKYILGENTVDGELGNA